MTEGDRGEMNDQELKLVKYGFGQNLIKNIKTLYAKLTANY